VRALTSGHHLTSRRICISKGILGGLTIGLLILCAYLYRLRLAGALSHYDSLRRHYGSRMAKVSDMKDIPARINAPSSGPIPSL